MRAGEDDHCLLRIAQAINQLHGFRTRLFKTGWLLIHSLHGGGGVEDNDLKLCWFGLPGEKGASDGKDGQQQQKNLEEKQPIVTKSLKGGICLGFGQESLPEQGAGD